MKCATCGRDNPAGARFCGHCGAELSAPTPIAVAAAMSGALRASPPVNQAAANASRADAESEQGNPLEQPRPETWTRDRGPASASPHAAFGNDGAQPGPAYATRPRRLGLVAGLLALSITVAIGAFVAWKAHDDGVALAPSAADDGADSSVMAGFPPDATPGRPRPVTGAATDTPGATESAGTPPPAATTPSAGDAAAEAAAPVEIKPLPARPRRARTHRPTALPPSPPATEAPAPMVPEPAPAPPVRAAVTPAPKVVAPIDRWTQMDAERARCTREDFIARVVCDQRVRFRYCSGYWGKVLQCPGNPAPERGQ